MVTESTGESVCAHQLHGLVLRFADAGAATREALEQLPWADFVVLGGGKAGRPMAEAISTRVGGRGIVGVPEGDAGTSGPLQLMPTGHPLPTQSSVDAVLAQEALVRNSDAPVLFLLSGGATAMLGAPLPGLTLSDLSATYSALLASGLDIAQMNVVRRHLTRWGGGKLARLLGLQANRTVLAWLVSDVMDATDEGDSATLEDMRNLSDASAVANGTLATIGSGPLAGDSTSYADALRILQMAADRVAVLPSVLAFCKAGMAGEHPETVRPGDACLVNVTHKILLSNGRVVERLANVLQLLPIHVLPQQIGDVDTVARRWAERLGKGPAIYIAGGEPTVRLEKDGFGGRNQHLALSVAVEAGDLKDWLFLSIATDGADGNTPHGGAWISSTVARKEASRLKTSLADFDSGSACRDLGLALGIRPTGTNVADIHIGISGYSALAGQLADVLRETR